jgi:hypothetical protein
MELTRDVLGLRLAECTESLVRTIIYVSKTSSADSTAIVPWPLLPLPAPNHYQQLIYQRPESRHQISPANFAGCRPRQDAKLPKTRPGKSPTYNSSPLSGWPGEGFPHRAPLARRDCSGEF